MISYCQYKQNISPKTPPTGWLILSVYAGLYGNMSAFYYFVGMIPFLLSILLLQGAVGPPASPSQPDTARSPVVVMIAVDGAINPPVTNYIRRGLARARQAKAECLLVQLDTPGGLLKSTQSIVQLFLDADDMPVVVYVAPEGASAASAGTFITMAAHIAAMAPATNIGAASPVQSAPGGGTVPTDTVMQKKIFNYSESYIRSIAERRGRNAGWAVRAVRDGESVTSRQALQQNVIDLVVETRDDLLQQIDGREVAGKTLRTAGARIEEVPLNLAEIFLGFIMRPEVILVLTMIAIYGIIGEVTNPGAVVPGVTGFIALILVLYASASMPINIAGFALIGLAVILFIAEAFTPAFGMLIAAGSVSFFLGALMLFQELPAAMALSWGWLVPATVLTALFFIWIAGAGIRIQFTEALTGRQSMVGKVGKVTDSVSPQGGRIFVDGEYWNAVSDTPIDQGRRCEIVHSEGLTMHVRPLPSSDQPANS